MGPNRKIHQNQKRLILPVIRKHHHLAILEGWLSIALNTLLFILKYWAGIVTGSIAIIADAWHTLSDSISSIILLIGARLTAKPADEEHPFGHGRAELIAALIIGVLLAIIASNFLMESLARLRHHKSTLFGTPAIVAMILSIILKEALANYASWAAKKTGYKSLRADSWHHRSDAVSSALILIGIFLAPYFWWIDGVLGILVALLIFYVVYNILKDTIDPLLGEEPSEKLVAQLKEICYDKTIMPVNIHHFHIHNYGQHTEITFHLRVSGAITLEQAHQIATEMENEIRKELNIEATIHMEPIV